MGMHPRMIQADSVLSITQRTIDRAFLFIPSPETRNFFGACAARAQITHPIKLYWLEVNINHEHMGLGPMDGTAESITDLVGFKRTFHRLVAEEINRRLDREGGIFSSPSRDAECLDAESVEQQLGYAMTNPVKDGLVDRAAHWEGFSSYEALAQGEDRAYTYIDRTAWHKAGGLKSGKPPEAFTKTVHLHFTPLPGTEDMSPSQRQARVRRQCRELEQKYREEREREGRTVVGKARLKKLDPRDRPKSKPERKRKPVCHGASKEATHAYLEKFRAFLKAYRAASAAYRMGCMDVVFPSGSFRPPLITAVT